MSDAVGIEESEVSKNTNWRIRVTSETKCSQEWNRQWGYMVSPGTSPEGGRDALDAFSGKPHPMRTARFASAPGSSLLAVNLRESLCKSHEEALDRKDSLEDFVHVYCTRANGIAGRMMPREEFRRPLCASHSYGWRPSLEVFGPMAIRLR